MKKVREHSPLYRINSSTTIAIPEIVFADLEEIIKWEGGSTEEAIKKAITHYYDLIARRKIDAESEMFRRKHSRLRVKYLGRYIAMHGGRVVDHDRDLAALNLRIRKRFGRTPVLMRLVEAEPERALLFRSPRLERMR